ncbi:MAG: single-stranded-DNA-specific exonuclease RecJ [Anaerolineaceae bacterium]|nr:single-stranded-DNA-specific exonuclease RecJ [Anaerolineaceae bacterium]
MSQPINEWVFPEMADIPQDLLEYLEGDTLLASLLIQRGIHSAEEARRFFFPDHYTPTSASELPDLDSAVNRINEAIERNQKIGIWGDFDADGQTATSLLVGALRALGADVCYHIPNRKVESHGVLVRFLIQFSHREHFDLLVTCDTGITAVKAAQYAKRRGFDMIITDHHSPEDELPPALAVVNPKLLPSDHPLYDLVGVGVAYKVIETLCERRGRPEITEGQLDLVAIGTVADVGILRGDNRYLVQRGLAQIQKNKRVGLKVLLATSKTMPESFNEEKISFKIAPRINSLGRLADANPIVEVFNTERESDAAHVAIQMEGLNNQRKGIQEDVLQTALEQIAKNPGLLDYAVIILYHPQWDSGVVGIAANSIVGRYGRPAILLTGNQDGICGGSARSIEAVNIIEAIRECADLLDTFGGHPMAAGMRLPIENIEQFREALSNAVLSHLPDGLPRPSLSIGAELPLDQINLPFIQRVELLAPFGSGNPRPTFVTRGLRLRNTVVFGAQDHHRKLTVEDEEGNSLQLIWWNGAAFDPPVGIFDIAYTLQPSNYNGDLAVEALWVDSQLREAPAEEAIEARPVQWIDLREEPIHMEQIKAYAAQADTVIWREGLKLRDYPGSSRYEIEPCKTLVLLQCPPSRAIFNSMLESAKPETVILQSRLDPTLDQAQHFLSNLTGMLKFADNKLDGWVPMQRAAVANCQNESTIRNGIELLATQGYFTILESEEDQIRIKSGGEAIPDDDRRRFEQVQLRFTLGETAAFRKTFQNAPLDWFNQS